MRQSRWNDKEYDYEEEDNDWSEIEVEYAREEIFNEEYKGKFENGYKIKYRE